MVSHSSDLQMIPNMYVPVKYSIHSAAFFSFQCAKLKHIMELHISIELKIVHLSPMYHAYIVIKQEKY